MKALEVEFLHDYILSVNLAPNASYIKGVKLLSI